VEPAHYNSLVRGMKLYCTKCWSCQKNDRTKVCYIHGSKKDKSWDIIGMKT